MRERKRRSVESRLKIKNIDQFHGCVLQKACEKS